MTMLTLTDATIGYGADAIVSEANLQVNTGDWLALMGPNGGGKTTLMKALIGILPLQAGKRACTVARVGYVPQRCALTIASPVRVREFLALNPLRPQTDTNYQDALIHELSIEPLLKTPIKHLSGGQLQRVMLAYALCGNPELIFLDEFLDGVDSTSNKRLLERLSARNKNGLTIVEISHDFATVMQQANRAAFVKRRIVFDGSPQDEAFITEFFSAHQYQEWIKNAEPS